MKPPPLAERLLKRALGDDEWADTIVGDLHEEYVAVAASRPHGARIWYWLQAIRLAGRYAANRNARRYVRGRSPDTISSGDSTMRTIGLEIRHAVRALLGRGGSWLPPSAGRSRRAELPPEGGSHREHDFGDHDPAPSHFSNHRWISP